MTTETQLKQLTSLVKNFNHRVIHPTTFYSDTSISLPRRRVILNTKLSTVLFSSFSTSTTGRSDDQIINMGTKLSRAFKTLNLTSAINSHSIWQRLLNENNFWDNESSLAPQDSFVARGDLWVIIVIKARRFHLSNTGWLHANVYLKLQVKVVWFVQATCIASQSAGQSVVSELEYTNRPATSDSLNNRTNNFDKLPSKFVMSANQMTIERIVPAHKPQTAEWNRIITN